MIAMMKAACRTRVISARTILLVVAHNMTMEKGANDDERNFQHLYRFFAIGGLILWKGGD